jgi:cell shape-determining protein MreC
MNPYDEADAMADEVEAVERAAEREMDRHINEINQLRADLAAANKENSEIRKTLAWYRGDDSLDPEQRIAELEAEGERDKQLDAANETICKHAQAIIQRNKRIAELEAERDRLREIAEEAELSRKLINGTGTSLSYCPSARRERYVMIRASNIAAEAAREGEVEE